MSRTTFKIGEFLDWVNERNRTSVCSPEIRKGWNTALEHILHTAEVYAGFNALRDYDVPEGQQPGIIFDEVEGKHEYPDPSRLHYFKHRKLR